MSKFRKQDPQGTPLDPFAFEKQFVQPDNYNPSQFSGVTDQLEFVTPEKIEAGYGTLGNASVAAQIIQETKAANQGALELAGKGLFNVAKTVGIEIAKTPGYLVGAAGAVGNELFGDGKNSMSYIVDNAWVNSFEQLDESLKEMIPVHISQQVQEGNLLDKLGSGAWWASTGADGLGFMLAMFAPGAVIKGLNVGSKIAGAGEKLANISTKLGKTATGASWVAKLGLMEATPMGFKYTKNFAQNANGYASAAINTVVESSAEAANTFDTLTNKYLEQGLTEEEAKLKAGEGAAAVFKGNMALLAISNILDEKWIWKSIGSGEKEAANNLLGKLFKNGVVDTNSINQASKQLSRKNVIKEGLKNFGKNVLKEGFYEEGSQTTLQQNIDEGKIEESVFGNLSNVASQYFDDFTNNSELHESIFLGGLLGGGASVVGTVQENKALKSALFGSAGRSSDNFWVKYGILPETKAQKGLSSIIEENHIRQFRSYKDLMTNGEIDDKKLVDSQLEQLDELVTDAKYDIAVVQNDELSKEIYGQFLASNYMSGFLGQEGSKELFREHVKNQVVPAWQKRFEDTHGRTPTAQETSQYEQSFVLSGERVLNAYESAEQTNYPERYYSEPTPEYSQFKQDYFHKKFQTLVSLDAVANRRKATEQVLNIPDSVLTDPVYTQKRNEAEKELKKIEKLEQELSNYFEKFFTKSGVKELYDNFKDNLKLFQDSKSDEQSLNEELKQQAEKIPSKNESIINDLGKGYNPNEKIVIVDNKGVSRTLENKNGVWTIDDKPVSDIKSDLSTFNFRTDDVSQDQYDAFKQTGEVSEATIDRLATKMAEDKRFSSREVEIANANAEKIKSLAETKKTVSEKTQETFNPIVEEESDTDAVIEEFDKDKGVNLFPSTGRHLLNELTKIEDGIFVEKLNPKVSQQLWFKTLDEEVSKNPTSYTAKVVRLDDKSNEELHTQILRDTGSVSNDSDLYVVLYKDGQPVVKGGSKLDVDEIEKKRQKELNDEASNITVKKETFAGLDVEDNPVTYVVDTQADGSRRIRLEVTHDGRTSYPIQEVISKTNTLGTREYLNMSFGLQKGKLTNTDDNPKDKLRDKINAKYDEQQGNYVFTSLWTPENLYPLINGKPKKFILAEKTILENFKLEYGISSVVKPTKADKQKLDALGFSNQEDLTTAAFLLARKEYEEWYSQLQQSPQFLQVAGITKGHRLKGKNETGKELWSNPLKNIPGVKLVKSDNPSPSDLKGGKLLLSTTGFIKVGSEELKISSGDTVLVDSDQNVHALKARNLTEEEAKTVAYLLSLRAETGRPTESFSIEVPSEIRFGTQLMKKIPVFFNEKPKMSRANLIESLISFGSKNGGKGEIYFNQETVATDPVLVWTDFNSVTHNIKVKDIQQAFETEDFSSIENLLVFLQQKRFNVNEHLIGTTETNGNPIFHKPMVVYKRNERGEKVPTVDWDSSKSYYDHLLNDVLTTNTITAKGYPNRVQRNIWFNKQVVQEEVFSDLTWGEEVLDKIKSSTGLGEISDMVKGAGKSLMKTEVEKNGYFEINITKASPVQGRDVINDMMALSKEFGWEFTQSGEGNNILRLSKKIEKPVRQRRTAASLDKFKEADKILTTQDLLKAKLKSGEITQHCK